MTASSSPTPKPTPGATAAAPGPRAAAGPDGATPAAGRHAAEPSVGQLVSDATTHLSTLIHSEIELAKLELRSSVKNAGTGAGFFAAAGVLAIFSLVYFFQGIAEVLARYLVPRWVAFFVVFGLIVVSAALFVFVGVKKVKRVKAPQRTIATTKETVDYLKKSVG